MDTLIVHMVCNPMTGTYKRGNSGLGELKVTIIPFSPYPDRRWIRNILAAHPTRLKIYPNSNATICLGGLTHLWHRGLSKRNLVPSKKKVRTVGGFSLVCQGWLPVMLEIRSRTTKQALYICKKIQVIYFSKAVCIDVEILPPYFPRPMTLPPSVTCDAIHPGTQPHKTDKPKFDYPYPPTNESIQNLKKWLLDQFYNPSWLS